MKLVKSLLLGSAAGFAAVAGASAADLPSRKAAPAEYVRVCSAYGAGFFYIPGTDVCLKVGGMARFEYAWVEPRTSAGAGSGFRSIGRVELDARNPTAYGTLRAFVRVDFQQRSASFRSGSSMSWGQAFESNAALDSGVNGGARLQNVIWIDKAFVQWGGLIAGRAASLFDFNKSPEMIGVLPASSVGSTNLIGYIATFGSGFYASVSLEDPLWRRQALSDVSNPAGTVQYYGGSRMPDIVANIGVEQSWGSAQLSAAVHQISTNKTTSPLSSAKYGWAVNAGVQINLPMIAPGDYLWLNAAYADGAMSYVYSGHCSGGCALNNFGLTAKTTAYWAPDAFINPGTGTIRTTKTWGIVAGFQHYWAPTLRSGFFGGYQQFKNPNTAGSGTGGLQVAVRDWDYWGAGANLIWTPVRGLDIGAEVAYQQIKARGVGVVNTAGVKLNDSAWNARFRIQRSF